MRVAPDSPEKARGFESHFLCEVVRQAGVPFTSSNFLSRKTGWVNQYNLSVDQGVMPA
jgi:hypothetical protein